MSPGLLGHGHYPGTIKDGGGQLAYSHIPGPLRHDSHVHPSPDLPQIPTPGPYNAAMIGTYPGAGPVIFEFDRGARKAHLTYPAKRSFYSVGDIILTDKLDRQNTEAIFPELKTPEENKASLTSILFMLIGGDDDERKIGWKILSIHAYGSKGVTLQGVLFLDDKTPLLLDKKRDLTEENLDCAFITKRGFASTVALAEWIEKAMFFVMATAATEGMGTLEKYLATEAGELALGRGMRNLVRIARTKFGKAAAKCSFAFLRGALVYYWTEVQKEKKHPALRDRANTNSTTAKDKESGESVLIEGAAAAGIDAMIDVFIDEWWKEPMMKQVDHAFEKALRIGSGRQIVKTYLAGRAKAVKPQLVKALKTLFIESFKESIDASLRPDFDKLADKMKENAGDKVVEAVTEWLKDMAAEPVKALIAESTPAR